MSVNTLASWPKQFLMPWPGTVRASCIRGFMLRKTDPSDPGKRYTRVWQDKYHRLVGLLLNASIESILFIRVGRTITSDTVWVIPSLLGQNPTPQDRAMEEFPLSNGLQ